MNKETTIGIIVASSVLGVVAAVTGFYGIVYIGLAFVVAVISIYLFSRKSLVAKTSAIILNTDLMYKILMPRKYKKAIRDLDENKKNEKT